MKKILVTGGAGFIGSNLVRLLVEQKGLEVVNVDKLTYAGNLHSLADLDGNPRYHFEQVDLCDADAIQAVFSKHQPDVVMHLAAESHVDRSIDGPGEFIQTNVVGTFHLLQAALAYWQKLPSASELSGSGQAAVESLSSEELGSQNKTSKSPDTTGLLNHLTSAQHDHSTKESFRFLHVSTDEVYGSLDSGAPGFSETTPYDPHSPYSASKAASDHLARAWGDTYGLPVMVTNCSNNYGPYQFPEKLIPVVILKCLRGEPIPVYGKGENIRDWLYVEDHAEALYTVLSKGRVGETYNIGGNNEQNNLTIVKKICEIVGEELSGGGSAAVELLSGGKVKHTNSSVTKRPLDDSSRAAGTPDSTSKSFQDLITFVTDRPGHDMRYAIDASKIRDELGWEPKEDFESGFRKTVRWYLDNKEWWGDILSGEYQLERLGHS